jgi:hypothetical protein
MGLDMYLTARKYIGGWNHSDEAEQAVFRNVLEAIGVTTEDVAPRSPHVTVLVSVGYWRKANQIHGWFVDVVQKGKDECQDSYVTREQLQQLLTTCKHLRNPNSDPNNTALEKVNKNEAELLLPPTSGFFFGSTDINEYYWQDIDYTIEVLERILFSGKFDGWDFYYHSSW